LSNLDVSPIEKSGEISATANRVKAAALWLCQHRDELTGPPIPALKERFGLRNIEAIEAAKQAHVLAYPGA
jgi:hypothetical protein